MIDFTHNPIIPADYTSRGRGLPYEASPLRVLSFCEKIYLGKNIEGTKILFSEGGNEVIQGTNGQAQGSYSSNAAQYITNDRVGVVAQ